MCVPLTSSPVSNSQSRSKAGSTYLFKKTKTKTLSCLGKKKEKKNRRKQKLQKVPNLGEHLFLHIYYFFPPLFQAILIPHRYNYTIVLKQLSDRGNQHLIILYTFTLWHICEGTMNLIPAKHALIKYTRKEKTAQKRFF